MNVLLVNGSPHKSGCTYTALRTVADAIEEEGIHTNIFHIGATPISGCIACGKCRTTKKCIFENDHVNECAELMTQSDGIIIGSPVFYAGPNGALCALLDRVFFSKGYEFFANKPSSSVVSCRRGGSTAALDRLNKYFTISSMPIVSSNYWNMVHGMTPKDVLKDTEGLQIMRTLGKNMAWLIKCIEVSKGKVPLPEVEDKIYTNFIR